MENQNTTSTALALTDAHYEGDLKSLINNDKYNISAPLFLAFAEYLGYVSGVLKWVDEWCIGKKPSPYMVKFIEIEAAAVLKEVKKEYDAVTIRKFYDGLYDVILGLYDENIKKTEETPKK